MKFEKIISKGIASNSYFIAANTQAVVIDPRLMFILNTQNNTM